MLDILLTLLALAVGYLVYSKFFKSSDAPTRTAISGVQQPGLGRRRSSVGALPPGFKYLNIFYGSQSGTAEAFACEMGKEAKAYKFKAKVIDLEEYDVEDLGDEEFSVFLVATHGEGDPTDSAEAFYEWLTSEDRSKSDAPKLKYAVFGLGNRQYEFYCKMGTEFDRLLEVAGGERLLEPGQGDDDANIDEDFAEWKAKFWKKAAEEWGDGDVGVVETKFEPSLVITWLEPSHPSAEEWKSDPYKPPNRSTDHKNKVFLAPIAEKWEARADTSAGSTQHFSFDLENLSIDPYITADNLGVMPRNDFKLVAQVAKRVGVDPDALFQLNFREEEGQKLPCPAVCTVRNALLWYKDLTAPPKKKFVTALAQYATNPTEAAEIKRITGPQGKNDYHEEIVNNSLSILQVLEKYPSVEFGPSKFADLLELLPHLQPRYYTISSSNRRDQNKVDITVKIVETPKANGDIHKGVATHYLASLKEGRNTCPIFIRPSSFRLPPNLATTPVIMIGPGTGLAPFRGFIQDGNALLKEGKKLAEWVLFFGCQYESKDFIYRDELEAAAQPGGCLTSLITAFSRDSPKKVYVQHRLEEMGERIWKLLEDEGAHVYVCGGTTMGSDVRKTFATLAERYGGHSADKAHEYVQKLQKMKPSRYVQELWDG